MAYIVVLLVAGVLLAPSASALAPSPAARSAAAERRLQSVERQTLGPVHAREHAAARRVIRKRARCGSRRTAARRALRRLRRSGRATSRRRLRRLRVGARRRCGPRRTRARSARAAGRVRASVVPGLDGRWDPPFDIPVIGIHAALLPTGKVMWFSYPDGDRSQNTTQAWLWDPGTGSTKRVDPPLVTDPSTGQLKPANIWCASQSHMPDGRLLVVGGNLDYPRNGYGSKGLDRIYTFDPFTETWDEQARMRRGRWYPTSTLLADGRSLLLGGTDETGTDARNPDVELFTPGPGGTGQVTLLGTLGGPGKPPLGGLYPHVFAMPSGRALVAGPEREDSWLMQPPGSPPSLAWQDTPDPARARRYGTAVLMPGSSRVMQIGGYPSPNGVATSTAEFFDEAAPQSGWRMGPSLRTARGHHNTVLLPDRSMVSIGGGYGARNGDLWAAGDEHRAIELYDPGVGAWRTGPSQQENRAYHSTAVLLPDGRVISAGDDYHGGSNRDTAEIYSPPYLFKGARPQLTATPEAIGYGARFGVSSPDTNVTRAVLMAPAATTHANDMSQRAVPLALQPSGGGYSLTAPAAARIAPPGYYMLFLVNSRGVPSVAKFVKLG